ncbi:hypothetical protein ACSSNL_03495 [Thalassobius sp. S69A]|uniref:hypothetical protein n=1 Tax=unclassified Thalassovita TaxID=2619711 RepID=UPI000C6B35D1|nr:hypothetical protein [Paracoccaceae bacterium]
MRLFLISVLTWVSMTLSAGAVELLMVERPGCHYCIEWKDKIGPIYPNSAEGKYAPLRIMDISDKAEGIQFARKVVYTPTFVLLENNQEIGRIEGYPGEDFFWGMLEMMLKAKTDYQKSAG